MAFRLEDISRWLDEDNTKHQYIKEKELIVFGAEGHVQTGHFIRSKEDGELLDYQVQLRVNDENLTVPQDHKHILVLLKYLLRQNYITKFGCWEYDYTDGDIRFLVEIPFEDATMTQKQFKRITSLMFGNVDTMMGNILKILQNGEMPEDSSGTDEALLRKLALLRVLEENPEMLARLMSESSKKDEDGI